MLVVALLATRPLRSADLGYHLAYGETFLRTGEPVDHNDFIYTLPHEAPFPEPGPGCWYDETGRYRFANANWLSQVVMAAVFGWAGPVGFSLFQAALIVAVFGGVMLLMRRLGVAWAVIPFGILLAALTSYPRFDCRPEVFGYLALIVIACLLVRRPIRRRTIAWILAMQLLAANLHSYFVLGPALTLALLLDRLIHLCRPSVPGENRDQIRREARRLGATLLGQTALSFLNPWTWRLAVLPFETLLFLDKHRVSDPVANPHPWAGIKEFFSPLEKGATFLDTIPTYAFLGILVLAATGVLAAALRRRWDWLAVIAGMTLTGLSMRRNIAVAAMLIAPFALAAGTSLLAALGQRHASSAWLTRARASRLRVLSGWAWRGGMLAAVLVTGHAVVTQRLYAADRAVTRFGVGLSRFQLPVAAGEWIRKHALPGRLWVDYSSSSNIHYFSGQCEVPILTNTWAYPPEVMARVLGTSLHPATFASAAADYDVRRVVIGIDPTTSRLAASLAGSKSWIPVHADGRYVVFERRESARNPPLLPQKFDVAAQISMLSRLDPLPARSLYSGALVLYLLGPRWNDTAAEVFAAATREEPSLGPAWYMLGVCETRRGGRRMRSGDPAGKTDWLTARDCFRRALALDPEDKRAKSHSRQLERRMETLARPGKGRPPAGGPKKPGP